MKPDVTIKERLASYQQDPPFTTFDSRSFMLGVVCLWHRICKYEGKLEPVHGEMVLAEIKEIKEFVDMVPRGTKH